MKLRIDTSVPEKIIISLDNKQFESKSYQDKSQKLLEFIETKLADEGFLPSDIHSIEVNASPGSFTGLRIGIAVAQTLGYVLNVPVNGYDLRKVGHIDIKYD